MRSLSCGMRNSPREDLKKAYTAAAGCMPRGVGVQRDSAKAKEMFDRLQASPIDKRYSIYFGAYPQGEKGETEPISWRVLDRKGDQLLLLSYDILDEKPYHIKEEDVTWEKCSLRKWLNSEFIQKAFTKTEREKLIAETLLDNPDNADYGTRGGNPTRDKVFLLSIKEAQKYFIKQTPERKDVCPCNLHHYRYETDTDDATIYDIPNGKYRSYWLRSPGWNLDAASYVGESIFDGSAFEDCKEGIYVGGCPITIESGVRPALWLNLKTDI